jgi:hypothetical protein
LPSDDAAAPLAAGTAGRAAVVTDEENTMQAQMDMAGQLEDTLSALVEDAYAAA